MSTPHIELTPPFGGEDLPDLMVDKLQQPSVWSEPSIYNLADAGDIADLRVSLNAGDITAVHDGIQHIAAELFEYEQPTLKLHDEARSTYISALQARGLRFGNWVHFPWSGNLVRYPEKEQLRALRTSRNRNLMTDEEQAKLYEANVAVFGLSVGSNIVERLVQSGIGGKIIMGDPDTISPTNLNRITADFKDVGAAKIDHMARKISEADPYIEQVHFRQGYTPEIEGQLIAHAPDLIFDEVDDLPTKARLRQLAKTQQKPLIMVTDLGDRSVIDVERHDLEDVKPFNGRLKQEAFDALLNDQIPPEEKMKLMTRIVGFRHVTTRMLESVVKIDTEISGMPQLGAAATIGAGIGAIAAREIILDRKMDTGRYVVSPKGTLKLQPQGTVRQYIDALKGLLRRSK